MLKYADSLTQNCFQNEQQGKLILKYKRSLKINPIIVLRNQWFHTMELSCVQLTRLIVCAVASVNELILTPIHPLNLITS